MAHSEDSHAGFRACSHASMERSNARLLAYARAAVSRYPNARLLDIGCDDGQRVNAISNGGVVWGIDRVSPSTTPAGLQMVIADVEQSLPIASEKFDVVLMNQVVEHIRNLDGLFSECRRLLQPNGSLIMATPNLASWHNIAALLLGQQAFSQSISQRVYLGNRFASHYGQPVLYDFPQHCHVLTVRGIKDLLLQYGFRLVKISGVNFFPLSALETIDKTHSQYLIAWAECA